MAQKSFCTHTRFFVRFFFFTCVCLRYNNLHINFLMSKAVRSSATKKIVAIWKVLVFFCSYSERPYSEGSLFCTNLEVCSLSTVFSLILFLSRANSRAADQAIEMAAMTQQQDKALLRDDTSS